MTKGEKEHFDEKLRHHYAIKWARSCLSRSACPARSRHGARSRAPICAPARSSGCITQRNDSRPHAELPADPVPGGNAGLGSPLVTAGGVVFYSGALDDYLRAYEETSGRKLWQARLPGGGQATPMTYRADGKQYVVVSAGGHGAAGTDLSDAFVAYSLP